MQEMVIYGVSFDLVGKQPIVLLKTADGNKFLPIWIGHPEAAAILMKLQGASTPRPMTHDLVTEMLGQLDAQVVRITVTELKENTFYASITVQQNGSEIERSEEHTSELQSLTNLVCRLLLEKKKKEKTLNDTNGVLLVRRDTTISKHATTPKARMQSIRNRFPALETQTLPHDTR